MKSLIVQKKLHDKRTKPIRGSKILLVCWSEQEIDQELCL